MNQSKGDFANFIEDITKLEKASLRQDFVNLFPTKDARALLDYFYKEGYHGVSLAACETMARWITDRKKLSDALTMVPLY